MSTCLSYRSVIIMSSASIMIFARGGHRLFGQVGDRGVGREQQTRDRGGVLQSGADDFRRIDDARFEQVFDFARRRVVTDVLFLGANLATINEPSCPAFSAMR